MVPKEKNISIAEKPKEANVLERKTMSLPETAVILGVGIFTLRRLVKAKKVKTIRLSERGHHLVAITEIERLLKGNQ